MKKERFLEKIKHFHIILPVLLATLLAIILSSSLILLLFDEKGSVGGELKSRDYKYIRLSDTNETSIGSVSITRELNPNEVYYYSDGAGSHMFVSNFGTNEYYCTGSCYCEDKEESDSSLRRSSSILSHGITYLVAATTSVIAYQVAKKYFLNECQSSSFQHISCPKSSIQSDVDHCYSSSSFKDLLRYTRKMKRLAEEEDFFEDDEEEEFQNPNDNNDNKEEEEEDKEEIYHCTGNCLMVNLRRNEAVEAGLNFHCEEYKHHSELVLHTQDKKQAGSPEYVFIRKHLNPYCRRLSRRNVRYVARDKKTGEFSPKVTKMYLCTGGYTHQKQDKKYGEELNESVFCEISIPNPEYYQ